MFFRLLLAFTIIPVVELLLLIEVGRRIGSLPTIGIVLLTGIAGAFLTKQQGLVTLYHLQLEAREGRVPTDSLLDGVFILIGGITLLTPGLATDALGFSFLLPFTRKMWREGIKKRLELWVRTGKLQILWWR